MKLRFTSRAADELEEIKRYLRRYSPQGAKNVRERIHRMVLHIAQHPYTGSPTDSGLRRMATIPYPYLIFYEIFEDEIVIIGIRHSARKPASMPGAV